MRQRWPFLLLIGVLIIAGVSTAVYRHQSYGIPFLPSAEQKVWQVEARIQFNAQGRESHVYLALPPLQDGFSVVDSNYASSGFGFDVDRSRGQERAHWTKRNAQGPQTLFFKVELLTDQFEATSVAPPTPAPAPSWQEPYRTAAQQVLDNALPLSADARSLAQQLVRLMHTQPPDQNISMLLDNRTHAELLTDLLLSAREQARTVAVLVLEDGRRRQALTTYVQVWQNDAWHLVDPEKGLVDDVDNFLLWVTDAPAVLEVIGGDASRVTFSMISSIRQSLNVATERFGDFDISLYSLPIAEQGMFKLIMLLPVGALVVVFMRIIIGLKTSGTFMPVLIALAFLQTELMPGLISFLLVISIGLVIRSYLSDLNLLLVARIAALVMIVIGIITLFSVVSSRMGLIGGLTITFFPMIILAWTIERLSIIWEEQGPQEVIMQGGGSLFVAVLAFTAMSISTVEHLAFNFPELHLVVLALILLLGRYTGYRLLELHRFAAFRPAND